MAWVTPKINWQPTDYINYTDLNRIKNNVQALKDSMFVTNGSFTQTQVTPVEYLKFTLPNMDEHLYYVLRVDFTGRESGQTYRNTYYFHGAKEYYYGQDCPFIDKEGVVARGDYWAYKGGYNVPIDPMFTNKKKNDLWYADEFNTVINNLDKIAEACGVDFIGKPYYYPNGATPTAEELNTIERTTRNLYNLINNPYRIYLGIGGYVGGRLTNALL